MNHRGVRVVSFVPGRVRIKLGTLMAEPGLVTELRSELAAIDGIEAVDLNKLTGSVAIRYDRKALRGYRLSQAIWAGQAELETRTLKPLEVDPDISFLLLPATG